MGPRTRNARVSLSKLPSGRWRAQVYHQGQNVSVPKVLGQPRGTSYATKREAKFAREEARRRLGQQRSAMTVGEFAGRWTTDPLYERPKESTNLHNAERIKAFVQKHRHLTLDQVTDEIVAQWLAGGKHNGQVPALRAMFNDASSAKAGRLISVNPFANLGIAKSKGNKYKQPPTEEQMWALVRHARDLTPPSFAAYLETACFTGIRPGELDALQWPQIRWSDEEIDITVQWNPKVRKFTLPKYGAYTIALVGHARETLLAAKRDSESPYVFATLRGTHYTSSSRTHHWNRVRVAAGLGHTSLYLATRHYFGWYALNVLGLDSSVIAEQLGHRDGGKLVEQLYGHPDRKRRLAKIREAYDQTGQVQPLRVVREDESA
jgi:integrase